MVIQLHVVGPRAVFLKYVGQPWADVKAAALAGVDGLALREDVQGPSDIRKDEFALRCSVANTQTLNNLSVLGIQNW